MLRDLLFREFQCYICLSISLQNCMCFVAKHWHEVFVKIMSIYYKFIFWYFWIIAYVFKMLEAHVYFVVKAQVRCGDDSGRCYTFLLKFCKGSYNVLQILASHDFFSWILLRSTMLLHVVKNCSINKKKMVAFVFLNGAFFVCGKNNCCNDIARVFSFCCLEWDFAMKDKRSNVWIFSQSTDW